MNPIIKKSDVAKIFPRRSGESHKGQNGRVLIIGGSLDYSGAPVLAGLGALGSGADLVYLLVPECNFEVSRSFYPDFIVRKYPGNYINSRTLDHLGELLAGVDAVLIGPGVGKDPESLRVIIKIIQKITCPVVLDAEAISAITQLERSHREGHSRFVITPHHAEMQQVTGAALPENFDELLRISEHFARTWEVTILLKGRRDAIVDPNMPTRINATGNAGMTVGGSGDVLAGVVTSLIAQHISPYDACLCAAFLVGQAGDTLYTHKGYNFLATDIALELPYTIKNMIG